MAISCDALQVYEGLEVLTGAATAAERERLEHRLLGFVPVTADFSVGEYMPLAHAEVDAALAAGRTPIVVGGTGLYLRAAVAELSLVTARPDAADSELWSPETRHPTTIFGLDMDRAGSTSGSTPGRRRSSPPARRRRRAGPRPPAPRAPPARRSASTSCSAATSRR